MSQNPSFLKSPKQPTNSFPPNPRFPFADVVERVEQLGAKKAVRRHAQEVKKGKEDDLDENLDDGNNKGQEGMSNLDASTSRDNVHLG